MATVEPADAAPPVRYVRICPSCGQTHAPEVLRCDCGVLLAGTDLVRAALPASTAASPASTATATSPQPETPAPAPAQTLICPYDDCGQSNPPGTSACVYCNRSLATGPELKPTPATLVQLPAALAARYGVVRALPARGAEAEIVLAHERSSTSATLGEVRAIKLYRQGILPDPQVLQRLAQVDEKHRVRLFDSGVSDGHAYEVMEYCALGSLRDHLGGEPASADWITAVVRELVQALAGVHAAGLVHRDLKPENVLLRTLDPLDLLLTDFSTASVMQATQRFTTMARTLMYAAPEALSGVIDAKADFWALGMMVLEMATGRHPYRGLSDAVVLHHLSTRPIDLSAVTDVRLHLLLQGLLVRDPAARWGAREIARWLARDGRLQAPASTPSAAPGIPPLDAATAGGGDTFAQPYVVQSERCHNLAQLATAYARHWKAGCTDLVSGQLLHWFTQVHPDQNRVRLLLHLRYERELPPDLQLLHFMLDAAPGISPVWKGRSIELAALLERAQQALQGDARAAQRLDEIRQLRVLQIYAKAGNRHAEEIAQRWADALDRFDTAWQALVQATQPDAAEARGSYEQLIGNRTPTRPAALALNPRLLAASYDRGWVQRLRDALAPSLAALQARDGALRLPQPVEQMDTAGLLAASLLLPWWQQQAERREQRAAQEREQVRQAATELRRALRQSLALLQELAARCSYWQAPPAALDEELERFFVLLTQARSLGAQAGGADGDAAQARRLALRAEPVAMRLRRDLHALIEHREANSGWFSGETGQLAIYALIALFIFGGAILWHPTVILLILGFLVWRLGPVARLVHQIHEQARRLQRMA